MPQKLRRHLILLTIVIAGMALVSFLFNGPTAYIAGGVLLALILGVGMPLVMVEPRPTQAKR